MGQSTSNKGSAITGGNGLPKDDPANVTRFMSAAGQAVAGTPVAEAHGPALPDRSGQRPHSAPSDQHRLSLPREQWRNSRVLPNIPPSYLQHIDQDGSADQGYGPDDFERRRPETQARRLVKRLAELVLSVELKPAAAVS